MMKGGKSAVPATPMKSSGTRTEPTVHPGSSLSTPPTSRLVTIAERSGSFDESVGYSDAKEDDDEEYLEEKAAMPDPGDDGSDGLKPSAMTGKATSRSTGNRPQVNGDTPAANKVLGRYLELMKIRSNWMQLFGPKQARQAVWMDLGALRKWKKKLRASFGVSEIGAGRQPIARRAPEAADPSKVPLPQTPKKRVNEGSDTGVFTATAEASPFMQDMHMVTSRNYDSPEDLSDSDSDSGNLEYLNGDLTEEWVRQIRELSKVETKSSTPSLELATHLPLGNIKPYFGLRNKSEKSMQWLRTFIYEMKGTHTPPNEWCMAFELSLQDGALHWYRELPRKTRPNVSVTSANYAKRLRLREVPDHDRSLEVRGINPGVLETRRRALVNITLGWERVYKFEMWIMNHSAGVDVVLGTDFMIPAGVRLDLSHGTARLPDEVMVPLIKSLSAADDEPYGTQVVGELPREPGYVRLRSNKYKAWQILAYAESRNETQFERERELYKRWQAEQPPAVKRREYPTPRNIFTRDAEDSGPVEEAQVYCAEDMTQVTDTASRECGRRDDSRAFRAVAGVLDGAAVERIPAEESEHTIPVSESGDRVLEQAQRQSSTHATDDTLCTESSNGVTSENIGASDQILNEPDVSRSR
ncbi:Hypothetical protein PHPALM_4869 [Phytophthora palmivora]|uniref:Eukaryotic/viral aspartic protease n=1 Tax=Phytophthora palmivora TaxID=4796 RepID=A0A2P4YIU8_9STRA|nr:Hypothetical protein PHPALM_4869 [Phytophthora palmivora]